MEGGAKAATEALIRVRVRTSQYEGGARTFNKNAAKYQGNIGRNERD